MFESIVAAILGIFGISSSIAGLATSISNASAIQENNYAQYMQELENYLNTSNYSIDYYTELISEYDKYITRDYDVDRAALEATEKAYKESLSQSEVDEQVQALNRESFGYDLVAQDLAKDTHATNVQKYESDLAAYDATLQSYDNQIAELRNAWGSTMVQNAASGNLTGSAALIAEAQKSAVVRAAGDTMTLKQGEGYMGQKWQSDLYDFMNQKTALDAEANQLKQNDIALQQTQLELDKTDSQLEQQKYELEAQGYEIESEKNSLADSLENAYKNKEDAEEAIVQSKQNIEQTYDTMTELDEKAGKEYTDYRERDNWTFRDEAYEAYNNMTDEEKQQALESGKIGDYVMTDTDKYQLSDVPVYNDDGSLALSSLSQEELESVFLNSKINGGKYKNRELTKEEQDYLLSRIVF